MAINTIKHIGRGQKNGDIYPWRSDDSTHPSKNCKGTVYCLGRSKTGLKLYIDCGTKLRVCNWRMNQDAVTAVLDYVYNNNYARA